MWLRNNHRPRAIGRRRVANLLLGREGAREGGERILLPVAASAPGGAAIRYRMKMGPRDACFRGPSLRVLSPVPWLSFPVSQ
jgi:hypothetical protein